MIVSADGLTPQSRATRATISAGGGVELSSTSAATSAQSRYPMSWNTASFCAKARAGPEPRAKNFSYDRLQPAYWLARQATTGCGEATLIVHGQRGDAASGASRAAPRPRMQISAILRPAARLPRALDPASIRVSPSAPAATEILRISSWRLSAEIRSAASRLTLTVLISSFPGKKRAHA